MTNAAISRREQRRVQHHELSRNQLLDAAEEVFGTKGYHDATLKEVAERAEFSVGSVYSFFAGKDDLFLQLFLRRGEAFLAGLREVVAVDRPPMAQIRAMVEFEVGFFRAHPHFGRLYLRTANLSRPLPGDVVDASGRAVFRDTIGVQTEVLAAAQRAGAVRPGDPEVLGGLLSGLVLAFVAVDPMVVSGGADATERLSVDDLAAMVTGALGVR